MSEISPVPSRRLGRTNLWVPVIPFGSAGFGDSFGVVPEEDAVALMTRAYELGINHIDTSPCYGSSLPKVGAFVRTVKRERLILTTRVCCHDDAPACTRDGTFRMVEYNLKMLGTDYLDGVMIHDPVEIAPVIEDGGTLDALIELKRQGVVRNIGIGCRPHYQLLTLIATGDIDFVLTFNDYNLLRQSAAKRVLPACARNDVGVLNGWSIVRGILTGRDVDAAAEEGHWLLTSPDIPRAKAIKTWCEREGIDMLALALQYCLRDRWIHGLPQGWRSIEQIEAAARAVTNPLPSDVWERFEAEGF
ncbi:MAG: aldo/keto reductase [Candidatus Poribacteria bacterium]|nr:aldo/keto reductase [Candidatus Poribacteria bacterium]